LEIQKFGSGISLKGTGGNLIENNIIDNCEIHHNGFSELSSGSEMTTQGIHVCYLGQGLEITDCIIHNNKGTGAACGDGGNGIFIYAGSPESKHEYALIEGNTLYNNDKAGFWTKMMLTESRIINNEAYNNGNGPGITDDVRGGIILRCKLSSFDYIDNNTVYQNNGDGIYIGGFSNEITQNIIQSNLENGIHLGRSDGSENTVITNNYIFDHAGNYYDINVFHEDGGGNTGDDNAGSTAQNYRDTGTSGDIYFTYPTQPDTTILTGPSGIIDYTEVTFNWEGDGYVTPTAGLTFSYKLEGKDSEWSAWSTSISKTYTDLENGDYTFQVKAKDAIENIDQSPAQRSFTVDVSTPDTTPPDTSITGGPEGTITDNDVTFTWTGSDDVTDIQNLVYQFKLENFDSSWSSWSSGTSKTYTNLENGNYIFKVKAKDASGNVDPSPAQRSFTVDYSGSSEDTSPPQTTILTGPSGDIDDTDIQITWTGTDDTTTKNNLLYSYKLEGGSNQWSTWSSSTATDYFNLEYGEYIFKVKAKDEASNVDPTPASISFTIIEPAILHKYQVSWEIIQEDISIENPLFIEKSMEKIELQNQFPFFTLNSIENAVTKTVKIKEYNIKSIQFKLDWKDDKTTNRLLQGKDTIYIVITKLNGDILYNETSTGEGHLIYQKNNINALPTISTIQAQNEEDALSQLITSFSNNFKDEEIEVKISITIGEKRLIKRIQDKGNEVNLTISYEYYTPQLSLVDTPPDTIITQGPTGEINSQTVEFRWNGSDSESQTDELVYSYRCIKVDDYDESTWSDWTLNTYKKFSNLENEEYLFECKAKDTAGNIDTTPATQSFSINYQPEDIIDENDEIDETKDSTQGSNSESQKNLNSGFGFFSLLIASSISFIFYKKYKNKR
jgi:parallel beta-helix repeat protein